ncbi:MAG TPA: DKNYY domain-containing protein [Flavobacteriales bacterium]|nr:DKNYY domain-containing protein [Flavobacteriales bacterium]
MRSGGDLLLPEMHDRPYMMRCVRAGAFVATAAFLLFSCEADYDGPGALGHGFRKAGDTILYHDIVLDNVDTGSFEVLDASFCKDSRRVFYFDSYRESQDYFITKKHVVQELEGADAATFTVLGHEHGKDRAQAWYQDRPFGVADLNSLMALDTRFTKDDVHAYLDRKPVPGSHGRSFALIDHNHASDTLHRYYILRSANDVAIAPIPCDIASFSVVDYHYALDMDHVFYEGRRIPGAEPGGFVVLGTCYARDGRGVFFRDERIEGADPATFALFSENENSRGEVYYAQDKDHIYVNAAPFKGVDRASFRILDEKYTVDTNGVYFRMKKVANADPLSFKVYPHFFGDADAEDRSHKYGDGKRVE